MAYSEILADRIRKALAHLPNIEEKKMFGSLAFIVNGKMCLTAGPQRIMCRIDPTLHELQLKKDGCTKVVMGGREYRGYIHINEQSLEKEKDFEHWIKLALEYNIQLTKN
ncbi:TfoX/Sxy family protein [Arenibacter sp. BSSL-BM3]|uniref:TfoX/Sxy family protein n=1 Tax=Arenibacter arenosicollis TaxID=2762274 RepID=A0ABR7QPY5_9FLAO|nr:TfoX/Sxy family protein [Arenibacter arenosicollis]MBC8769263.1 TfoX/Sxy family protein [Arenibacter arenosicollis]